MVFLEIVFFMKSGLRFCCRFVDFVNVIFLLLQGKEKTLFALHIGGESKLLK